MLGEILYYALFFLIPVSLTAIFGISIYRYLHAKKMNKKDPETFSDAESKKRKTQMIVLAVVAVLLDLMVVGLIFLMYLAVAYM